MRKPRITKRLKNAFKQYYTNRTLAKRGIARWNKQSDLKNIFSMLPRSAGYQACAGTFWICWNGRIQTTHNENNYWIGRVIWTKEKGEITQRIKR